MCYERKESFRRVGGHRHEIKREGPEMEMLEHASILEKGQQGSEGGNLRKEHVYLMEQGS